MLWKQVFFFFSFVLNFNSIIQRHKCSKCARCLSAEKKTSWKQTKWNKKCYAHKRWRSLLTIIRKSHHNIANHMTYCSYAFNISNPCHINQMKLWFWKQKKHTNTHTHKPRHISFRFHCHDLCYVEFRFHFSLKRFTVNRLCVELIRVRRHYDGIT